MRIALLHALSCVFCGLGAPCAFSQDIHEIIIHGQQGEQRVADFPVSVSAVGAQEISRWNFTALEDLQQVVPNLKTFSQYAYANTLAIRGVGTYSRNIGFDERVGLYLDGIYLGPSYGLNQNLLDLQQVEVFRGPQGTHFGRNSIAGAVQLVSMQPDEDFGGQLLMRAGNRGIRTVRGRLSMPLSPALLSSIAVGQQHRDGLTANRFTGDALDDKDRTTLRMQLLYAPSATFVARLVLDRNELDESMLIGDPLSDTFAAVIDTAAPGPYLVDFNTSPTQAVTTQGAGLVLTWTMDTGSTLQAWTGLRQTDAATRNDTDYSRADILHVDYVEDYEHLSEEIRFSSAVNANLRYALGLHYLDQRGTTDRHVIAGSDGGLLGMAPGGDLWNAGWVDTDALSFYGSLEMSLFNQWDLAAGLRWSSERKHADWRIDTLAAAHFGVATGAFDASREDTDLSPSLSLSRQLSDTTRLFLRYAEGFKSGGYNLDYVSAGIFPNGLDFSKESARSYEAGMKGSLFGTQARFSATAFQVDYRDFQVNQFRDLGGGNTIILITNAAKVRTRGLEFELTADLADNLTLAHTLAWLDARYLRFADGGIGNTDVSGKRLDAPKVQASLSIEYEKALANGLAAFVNANLSYNADHYITPDNITRQPLLGGSSVPYGQVPALKSASLKLGVSDPQRNWHAALWVQNLLDDRAVTSGLRDFFGTITETRREPRTIGIELAYEF